MMKRLMKYAKDLDLLPFPTSEYDYPNMAYKIVEKISNVEVYYRDTDLKEGEEAPKDEDGNEIASDTPKEEPVMKSVTVETYGIDYGEPVTVTPFDISSLLSSQYLQ